MRITREIRNRPFAVFTVVGIGLLGWIVFDLLRMPPPNYSPEVVRRGDLPTIPPGPTPAEQLAELRSPPSSTILPMLKPGMTRVAVETLLGPPTADDIHPVSEVEGRMTYRMAYELADPEYPMTVRPINTGRGRTPPPPEMKWYKSFVALEFDASKPGHPLLAVHFLDPLF